MAETARPRPRPKPKPVAKKAPDAGSSPVASSSTARRVIEVNDTDDMFIINRGRSNNTWQKLDNLSRDAPKTAKGSDSEENDSEQESPRSRKRHKKQSENALPKWQTANISRLLSNGPSDSDSDLEIVAVTEGSQSTPQKKRKKKQARSRSRSITPPPALPLHQIQNIRKTVRDAFNPAPRDASPTPNYTDFRDDSTDTIVLLPELRAIANRLQDEVKDGTIALHDGPSDETLVITVQWQPHPLDPGGKQEEAQYRIGKNDTFQDLFKAIAEEAGVRPEFLVVTYKGAKIFSSIKPRTLKIYSNSVDFVACNKTTYEYIQQNPQCSNVISHSSSQQTYEDNEGPSTSTLPPESQNQESDAESEADGDKFKLHLRSSLTGAKAIVLTVRSTTKCGAILKAFLKKAGLADQYPEVFADVPAAPAPKKGGRRGKAAAPSAPAKDPRLCIDGEKMSNDSEIGDADLEDGDQIEVVGL